MRVLIIEDDLVLAEILSLMLEDLGISVCGREATQAGAINSAAHCRPDLLISDVNLQIGTGPEAVAEICKDGEIPCIFVSGDLTHLRETHPGAISVQKPYTVSDIAEAIQKAMVCKAA